MLGPIEDGDEEVGVSILVVVGGGHALGKGEFIDSGCVGNVFKGAVSLVMKKLAASFFRANKQVEQPVIVDIRPGGRLRGGQVGFESAFSGHVGKCAVAVIPHERAAHGELPSSAQ